MGSSGKGAVPWNEFIHKNEKNNSIDVKINKISVKFENVE